MMLSLGFNKHINYPKLAVVSVVATNEPMSINC